MGKLPLHYRMPACSKILQKRNITWFSEEKPEFQKATPYRVPGCCLSIPANAECILDVSICFALFGGGLREDLWDIKFAPWICRKSCNADVVPFWWESLLPDPTLSRTCPLPNETEAFSRFRGWMACPTYFFPLKFQQK